MNLCLDACFLTGLYDDKDEHHERCLTLFVDLFDAIPGNTATLVWPVLYEAVSTRLVRQRTRMARFERNLQTLRSRNQLLFLDDQPYRDEALDLTFAELRRGLNRRSLSLTDRVLRAALADVNVNLSGIVTFNDGDFIDVCMRSGKAIVG